MIDYLETEDAVLLAEDAGFVIRSVADGSLPLADLTQWVAAHAN